LGAGFFHQKTHSGWEKRKMGDLACGEKSIPHYYSENQGHNLVGPWYLQGGGGEEKKESGSLHREEESTPSMVPWERVRRKPVTAIVQGEKEGEKKRRSIPGLGQKKQRSKPPKMKILSEEKGQ